MTCPICNHTLVEDFKTPRVAVRRCPGCAHRLAEFTQSPSPLIDYHEKHGAINFVKALEQTRLRQSEKIISRMRTLRVSLDNLLDFGAGRAWLVRTLLAKGAKNIAGGDSSELSLQIIRDLGAVAIRCEFDSGKVRMSPAPTDIHTASFLDVIEHFPPTELNSLFLDILSQCPLLQTVIVKVPVSSGVLYRVSAILRRLRQPRWIEQLFQVGSDIPHHHYFSRTSLNLFLNKQGFEIVACLDDAEVDDIAGRAHIQAMPRLISKVISGALKCVAGLVGCDARIVIARRAGVSTGH
jgi:hypothetical protein